MKTLAAILLAAMLMPGSRVSAATPKAAFFAQVGEHALSTHAAPGIALAVVHNGRIVYEHGFGYANVEARTPVTSETRFSIGSLTKQLTAASIMVLAQQHKLSLDDPLAKYVPSLPNAGTITLRMLLNQTSGLHNYPGLTEHEWPLHGRIPLSRVIAILGTDKPDFAPGTKWEYSNANYAALAAVIEKVTGGSYAQFVRQRIFSPLHMQSSGIGLAAQQQGTVATGYIHDTPEAPPWSLDIYSGAGGAISSAHDLALWDIALMHGTLVPKPMIAQMWSKGTLGDYGMGWIPTTVAGHREVWHNGLAPGVGGYCFNAIFPDDGLAVVVLTNGYAAMGVPERMVQKIAAAYGIGTAKPIVLPTEAPGDNTKIDTLARTFWDQLGTGTVDRATITPSFSKLLTPQFLAQIAQQITLMGPLRAFTFIGSRTFAMGTAYRYELTLQSGVSKTWVIYITPDGKIAGSGLQSK